MRRNGLWICSSVLACVLATLGANRPPPPQTTFGLPMDTGDDSIPLPNAGGLCQRPAVEQAPPSALAIIVIPGPMDSTRISYEIWNYSGASMTSMSIDGFDALGGQGLLFNKVTTVPVAYARALRVDYPQPGVDGKGPILLGFDGFRSGQCAAIDSQASTWDQPQFRGCVMDAVGARISVVFEQGLRGNGEVVLCGSNGRVFRDVPCHPGDAVALISGSPTMQVRISK